jgi:hypothetical protein
MDRSVTTSSPAVSAPSRAGDECADVYADRLRDLKEALQEPPEFVFRAGDRHRTRLAA